MTGTMQAVVSYGGAPPPAFAPPAWDHVTVDDGGAVIAMRTPAIGAGYFVFSGKNIGGSAPALLYGTALTGAGLWIEIDIVGGYPGPGDAQIDYGNNIFVCCIGSNRVIVASDTAMGTWTTYVIPTFSQGKLMFAEADGLFYLLVNAATTAYYTSPDGINWTAQTAPASASWVAIAEDRSTGDIYIATASSGTKVAKKPFGAAWNSPVAIAGGNTPNYMAAGNGKVVFTITASTTKVYYSSDGGATFGLSADLDASAAVYGVVKFFDGKFYLTTSTGALGYYSDDGINWTQVAGMPGPPTSVQRWTTDYEGNFASSGSTGSTENADCWVVFAP